MGDTTVDDLHITGRVTRLVFAPQVQIEVDHEAFIAFAGDASILVPGAPPRVVRPEDPLSDPSPLAQLYRALVTSTVVDDRSTLLLTSDRLTLEIASDPDFEAWEVRGPGNRRLICLPGGDIAVWGDRAAEDRPTRPPI